MDMTIETDRLFLRPPEKGDAESMFEQYARHPEVARYLPWSVHKDIETTQTWLKEMGNSLSKETGFHGLLVPKNYGKAIGAFSAREHPFKVDVGYAIGPEFWGKGYMSEILRAVIHHYFTYTNKVRVEAICDVENTGSARVMEKAGMTREAFLPRYGTARNIEEGPRDMFMYGIIKT
ncbi:MAG: GNAT family N-acetyltransferase [Bacteroidia bacterium]|nr:GNAT family N-acetyltransferase [Bacteroidia bacterium]